MYAQSLQSMVGKFNQTNVLIENHLLTFMSDVTYIMHGYKYIQSHHQ